jgi:malonyl-CoA O-methyltransferase
MVAPIATRFQEKASIYEAHAGVQAVLAGWLGEWLEEAPSPETPGLEAAWELGAGTGLFTRHLLQRGFSTLRALDISPAMVAEGRRQLPAVEWGVGDAWSLPPQACARLYSASLLQWAPDAPSVLRNWCAALRPGGRMLHGLFTGGTFAELRELVSAAVPLVWFTPEEWLGHARAAGLRIVRSSVQVRFARHDSAHALFRHLHNTGATGVPKLSAGRLRALLRAYDARFSHPEGGVVATWEMLRFEAVRA